MERVPAIESPSNPLIREIARGLEERTLLLLEGEKTILDAVAAGLPLEHVLHDASIRAGRLAALTAAQPRLVSRAVLERLKPLDEGHAEVLARVISTGQDITW